MKGVIFNLLEQVVSDELGEDTWEALLDDAGLEGVYTAVGTYPHQELHQLVVAASSKLDKPADEIVRWFGRSSLPLLAGLYPGFFADHLGAKSFLLTLNDVIHPEVRKLFPGAYAPTFEIESIGDDTLSLGYNSYRDLCSFAEGLVDGVAAHYGQSVTIEQSRCTKRGDDRCVLDCTFSAADERS
jgi:heme-NO-binding protein